VTRVQKSIGFGFGLCLAAAFGAIWQLAFRTPPTHLLPLPHTAIAVDSVEGQKLLAESHFTADHRILVDHFVPQSRRGYCGVASSVIVVNALLRPEPRLSQSTLFTDSVREVRTPLQVTFAGMTLDQLQAVLIASGLEAWGYHADRTKIDFFRSVARDNLQREGDFVVVNYQRSRLGQAESAHTSPLAAYHAASDRFLVLDVAAHKYPPVWVTAGALWNAMKTTDDTSGDSRGFVVVREKRE
jgi:hypothetical protein